MVTALDIWQSILNLRYSFLQCLLEIYDFSFQTLYMYGWFHARLIHLANSLQSTPVNTNISNPIQTN